MTSSALNTYETQLNNIMGENGQTTEAAIYDPSGSEELEIFGVFDEHTSRGDKDGGNVYKKLTGPRFITAESMVIDIYENEILQVRGTNYTIEYIDRDKNGVCVIWLY